MSLRHAAAILPVLAAALIGASTASADVSWHDGQFAQSTMYVPCLGTTEAGAAVWTGYQSDPATTRAGDVFWAHVVFGAPDSVGGGCAANPPDQMAELELVLPPGVSPAVDAQHPISCSFYDPDGPVQTNPTCPTHTVPGTYGPMLPAGDGGAAWDMPPGRTLDVQFPLVSNRELKGAAEGHCPTNLNEISSSPQRDCLLIAEHVFDGTTDPWLLPNVQMVILPPAAPSGPTGPTGPTGPAGPTAPTVARPALSAAKKIRLSALLAHGVTATLTVPTAGATATLTLEQGSHTLGKVTRPHLAAGKVKVRVALTKAARRKLRHARSAHLTLVEKIGATTLEAAVLAKR